MGYLLRQLTRILWRLIVVCLLLGAALGGWRAFLRYGPGNTGPAMFQFHAKALLRRAEVFPRPVPDILLPIPQPMSSADVQLRLMKWWDGKNWLPSALAHGVPGRTGLRLHSGEVMLVTIKRVDPLEIKDNETLCKVRCQVRWNLPEELQELFRVREIVGLHLPGTLGPGQGAETTCVFSRHGWQWELVSAESPWGGKLKESPRIKGWMDWVF
jgi:hypothetical protein